VALPGARRHDRHFVRLAHLPTLSPCQRPNRPPQPPRMARSCHASCGRRSWVLLIRSRRARNGWVFRPHAADAPRIVGTDLASRLCLRWLADRCT
jgi:hypothetical protein